MNKEKNDNSISASGDQGYITVFGAANIDIGGKPFKELTERDSNPGTVRMASGGVGRNIAHNLSLLGNRVKFISAFGDDVYAAQLRTELSELGIDTNESLVVKEDSTSVYLFITDKDGNMELAVNDMGIYGHLTPEFIQSKQSVLAKSALVVVDANLPEEAIETVCRLSPCPVIAESVSCSKVPRLKRSLPFIHTITGTYPEAGMLTGTRIDPDDIQSLRAASHILLKEGVKRVVITLSERGVYFADKDISKKLPPLPARMVNGNGAGDSLLSGLITGFAKGLSFEDSVLLGLSCASITLETSRTNNPALSYELAAERVNQHDPKVISGLSAEGAPEKCGSAQRKSSDPKCGSDRHAHRA